MFGYVLGVTAKSATPDRYVVDKTGVPDPEGTEYYVLNLTHDASAREALAYLGNKYRQRHLNQLSQECFDALNATLPEFRRVMEARNAQLSKKKTGK